MNSLANFYLVDIKKINKINHEFELLYLDSKDIDFPLPYQVEALKLYNEYIKKITCKTL